MSSTRSIGAALVACLAACGEQEPAAPVAPTGPSAESTSAGANSERAAPTPAAIHLEERLDTATLEGGSANTALAEPLRWSFADGAAGWKALPNFVPGGTPAEVTEADGALRVHLTETSHLPDAPGKENHGGVVLEVSDFELSDWAEVIVRARITGPSQWMGIGYGLREKAGETAEEQWPTLGFGAGTFAPSGEGFREFRFGVRGEGGPLPDTIRHISIEFGSKGPATYEFQSIELVPASATYAEAGFGVRSVSANAHEGFGPQRRTLYMHAPARASFAVRLPAAARLDLALGSLVAPARMSVTVDDGGEQETVLEETVAPVDAWDQRSIDLARWAGRDVTVSLAADPQEASRPGIAFWASPTISSAKPSAKPDRPNVIFYVIDGASAGYMSVYGYERPTTPNLERIAAEGVVFEQAHSNATWTMPSTASFMTSLYHSVLGSLRNDANPVPPDVKTMAEHFHDAGFHTGVFTFNPNAGALSGLDRAVDVFRDFGKRGAPLDPIEAISSKVLHEQFWEWRESYPGSYWVHFQTTDVHPPHHPPAPFAGRLISAEKSEEIAKQMMGFRFPFNHTSASVHEHWQGQLAEHDIDPLPFYRAMQDSHDEAMMHQDQRLGELVDRLKANGEWENTLFVLGSDHGHPAASYPRFGRGQLDPQPPAWEGALLGEFESHVPLIFVWPGRIEGGRRIEAPVSMIDVLPTVLELTGLPAPPVAMGHSLAPVLLGEDGWEPGPVVFDEFRVADDGTLIGNLEVRDGRWGQSLEIRTADQDDAPALGRHPAPAGGRWKALEFPEVSRFLLYDLEADPRAIHDVSAEHPEVAKQAQERLWEIWKAHQALAATLEEGEEVEMSPEQLEALRALGYAE